jgi:hypothetical protein
MPRAASRNRSQNVDGPSAMTTAVASCITGEKRW